MASSSYVNAILCGASYRNVILRPPQERYPSILPPAPKGKFMDRATSNPDSEWAKIPPSAPQNKFHTPVAGSPNSKWAHGICDRHPGVKKRSCVECAFSEDRGPCKGYGTAMCLEHLRIQATCTRCWNMGRSSLVSGICVHGKIRTSCPDCTPKASERTRKYAIKAKELRIRKKQIQKSGKVVASKDELKMVQEKAKDMAEEETKDAYDTETDTDMD